MLLGCAQIVGVGDLPPGGGSGSGSGGGSSSGTGTSSGGPAGPAAYAGTWSLSGTETSPCFSQPQAETGTQQITAGPGGNQITLLSSGCNLLFTLRGASAELDPGQSCSGTATATGDPITTAWTSGVLTLDSPTKISASLDLTVTDLNTGGSCSANLAGALTK